MKDEHKPGYCMICSEDKPVRNKNIYIHGSEGTDMCIDCEMDMVDYLRRKSRGFFAKKLMLFKSKRKRLAVQKGG